MSKPGQIRRWGVFNLVGIAGFGVQLAVLFLLKRLFGLNYLLSTALAVEAAVLHNFFWHERVTWADVARPLSSGRLGRLLRFHAANGLISLAGNVVLSWVLVEYAGVYYLLANGISVVFCSAVNFVLSDRFVFRPGRCAGGRALRGFERQV
jgi:putative flippase GtrA